MGNGRTLLGREARMTPLADVARLADRNAYAAFASRFRAHLERRFVESFDGRTLSYGDVDRATAQIAGLLAKIGVRKGDRVAGLVEKSPEALLLYLAELENLPTPPRPKPRKEADDA